MRIIGIALITPLVWLAGTLFANYKLKQGKKMQRQCGASFVLALWGFMFLLGIL